MRIELTTSSLPRKCSTPELQRLLFLILKRTQGPHVPPSPGENDRKAKIHPTFTTQERKTRFEPATYSLEGCRSTN